MLALCLSLWPLAQAAGPAAPAPGGQLNLGPISVQTGTLPPPSATALRGGATMTDCPRPAARLDRVLYDHLRGQGAELSCGNLFLQLLELPGDPQQLGPQGGYRELAAQIRQARSEVLLANMVWDSGPQWPGRLLAQATADLRADVLAHPEAYPQGMTVRILLGHSVRPEDAPLDPRLSLDYAAQDLLAAGLPLTGEAEGPWRLELADYAFAVPHSHTKLLVTDRERVLAGGFNISNLHLPLSTPGGRGSHDLGLAVKGPVARQAVAAFEDLWSLSPVADLSAGSGYTHHLSAGAGCLHLGPASAFCAADLGLSAADSRYRSGLPAVPPQRLRAGGRGAGGSAGSLAAALGPDAGASRR
ncbi:hypothetical protein [Deinococcus sp. Marseille-Q6407]|uniref:hypothetical protein n=1 Tax=Deinococcus sp. Marseille-Q6407 TaxID=2969223 RepID=UPI0021BEFDAE|nr:hypothetical protein [Deinococcus sp. Marseille-Q6407]